MSFSLSHGLPQMDTTDPAKMEKIRQLLWYIESGFGFVLSATTTAQPVAPVAGDCYIVPAGATGSAWAAMTTGSIAQFVDGQIPDDAGDYEDWIEREPRKGYCLMVTDTATLQWCRAVGGYGAVHAWETLLTGTP